MKGHEIGIFFEGRAQYSEQFVFFSEGENPYKPSEEQLRKNYISGIGDFSFQGKNVEVSFTRGAYGAPTFQDSLTFSFTNGDESVDGRDQEYGTTK